MSRHTFRVKVAAVCVCAFALALAACSSSREPTVEPSTASTTEANTPAAEVTPAPAATAISDCAARGFGDLSPGEIVAGAFVCISSPLPGTLVTAPVVVTGWAAGTFEGNVAIDVLDADGTLLGRPATVAKPGGQDRAGKFIVRIDPDAPSTPAGQLRAWLGGAKDGEGVLAEASVPIRFTAD